MTFVGCSFHEFATYIKKTRKKIICYGAGMLPLYIEPLLRSYNLSESICLFIDSDSHKKGTSVHYAGKDIYVETLDHLTKLESDSHVILITAERYTEIQDILINASLPQNWECYAYPLLNLSYFKSMENVPLFSNATMRMPKVLHYTWFGRQKKQALQQKCIESWRRFCPNFEIKEWNENNYDIHKNQYMKQAYENQKWAYVSDYARLDILYQYGGIYLDTDVELFRSLEPLLNTKAFLCFGEWPVPNSGAGMGCNKGNPLIKELMNTRESLPFIQDDGRFDPHTNSNYEMQILINHGFHMDFTFQLIDGITLYPPDVIAPVSTISENTFVTERTLGIHYCQNTWRN